MIVDIEKAEKDQWEVILFGYEMTMTTQQLRTLATVLAEKGLTPF
jgi:hypothetical protein